jgi:fluoride ion exporter CrcB/FEX
MNVSHLRYMLSIAKILQKKLLKRQNLISLILYWLFTLLSMTLRRTNCPDIGTHRSLASMKTNLCSEKIIYLCTFTEKTSSSMQIFLCTPVCPSFTHVSKALKENLFLLSENEHILITPVVIILTQSLILIYFFV